jgi:hypothetical protein
MTTPDAEGVTEKDDQDFFIDILLYFRCQLSAVCFRTNAERNHFLFGSIAFILFLLAVLRAIHSNEFAGPFPGFENNAAAFELANSQIHLTFCIGSESQGRSSSLCQEKRCNC